LADELVDVGEAAVGETLPVPTEPSEQPISVADKTNTAVVTVVALQNLM